MSNVKVNNSKIYGSIELPRVLEKTETLEYIEKFKNGDDEARRKLIEHNLRLLIYEAKKFENTGIELEELISIGTLGLLKGINSYEIGKNTKLATYITRCIDNEILMYLKKNRKHSVVASLDEPINVDCDGNELKYSDVLEGGQDCLEKILSEQERTDEIKTLYEVIDSLNDRERIVIVLYFGLYGNKCHIQMEIADILGVSQSYVTKLIKKGLAKIKEGLNNYQQQQMKLRRK